MSSTAAVIELDLREALLSAAEARRAADHEEARIFRSRRIEMGSAAVGVSTTMTDS